MDAVQTGRSDDNGCLRCEDSGIGTIEMMAWSPRDAFASACQPVAIEGLLILFFQIIVGSNVTYRQDQEIIPTALAAPAVDIVIEVFNQLEPAAWHQEAIIALRFDVLGNGFDFFHPDSALGIAISVVPESVCAAIFIRLDLRNAALLVQCRKSDTGRSRILEIETVQGKAGRHEMAHR